MWYYLLCTPPKTLKPALQWISAHKHQIQWSWSLPYDCELLCCAGFGPVGHIFWDTGHGMYNRASKGVSQTWRTLVDCYVNMNCNTLRIETPLPMHFLRGFQCRPLLFIVLSFVGVTSNVKSRPISPTKKLWKSWPVGPKRMPFPPPTDRIRPHILVDCCVISFNAWFQVGVEVIPSEPSRIDTPRCTKK